MLLIMVVFSVIILSSCGDFLGLDARKFNDALEKLKVMESYSVKIKDELISSDKISGQITVSNTNFYKGIIEYENFGSTNYYFLNNNNVLYDMIEISGTFLPESISDIETESNFGIIDFTKDYDVEFDDVENIFYVYGLLGITKAEFKINDDGVLYEIISVQSASVGSSQYATTVTYENFDEANLDINFIDPDEMIRLENLLFTFGDYYQINSLGILVTRSDNTSFLFILEDDTIFLSMRPYEFTYNLNSKVGTLVEEITKGSINFNLNEYLSAKVYTTTRNNNLDETTVNEIIEFINTIYKKGY